ncbi:MAG TPA: dockerin type I domain-containing protein, partial [Xanthomonadales bacterium]|nr:dockerin type I domain-containing protein [Xanthomonadales bacterium]
LLHGLGKGGDSASPGSGGNANPQRPQRTVQIEVFNTQNQLVLSKTGQVSLDNALGNFKGIIDLGPTFPTGIYSVKVKSDQFLKSLVPGIQNITTGSTNLLTQTTLVTGDINNDNKMDILDYNTLIDCYSDITPARNCSDPAKKTSADITDDGGVNQFDYNLFLRELTNRAGE